MRYHIIFGEVMGTRLIAIRRKPQVALDRDTGKVIPIRAVPQIVSMKRKKNLISKIIVDVENAAQLRDEILGL
jgi:hypothetical protein